ncbi:MAG: hypothetical protein PVJ83_05540, partial [Gammaproteobacteria bacterium]
MPQGKFKKALVKKTRKGAKGYPIATIAFYGPDNTRASKVVCSIFAREGAEPDPMRKWFTDSNAMKSEAILSEVVAFIEASGAVTVSMADSIMGCPHEEGIDY